MTAFSIFTDDELAAAVPLDVVPLIQPYLQHRRVSIRIERLPPRARLSKGRNNGDGTFSLRPDEVDDLAFIPADGQPVDDFTLAVRIVKLDGDYASTLALLDLPVDTSISWEAQDAPGADPGPKAARASLDGAWRKNGTPPADADDGETAKLQRAFDVLAKALAETEARAEHAEAQIAELQNRAEEAEAQLAAAPVGGSSDKEVAALRQQLESKTAELTAAHTQAVKALEADHAKQIAKLESGHTKALEKQEASIRKSIGGDSAKQAAEAARLAEKSAATKLDKARQAWEREAEAALAAARAAWQAEEATRLADAARTFEAEKSQLQKQLDVAVKEIAAARTQTSEQLQQSHTREIAELKAANERALEEQIAATEKKLEAAFAERLAVAVKEAKAEADKRLDDARETWAHDAAQEKSEAVKPLEAQIADLHKQLKAAEQDIETARNAAADETGKAHAAEITQLKAAHLEELEKLGRQYEATLAEQVAATKAKLEADFAGRLDKALKEASKDAEKQADARLAEQLKKCDGSAAEALAAAREQWQLEEAERRAEATAAFEEELGALREKLAEARSEVEAAREQALSSAKSSQKNALEALKRDHAQALEDAVAAARSDLERAFADQKAAADDAHAKEVKELEAQLDVLRGEADAAREEAAEAAGAAKTSALEEQKGEHEQALEALRSEHERALDEALTAAKAERDEAIAELTAQLEADASDRPDPAELTKLREQLDATKSERDKLRAQIAEATKEAEARERIAQSLESTGDPEFDARLAEALHQAENDFEARLAEERKGWESRAQELLAKAKEKWQAAEEERVAAAMKQWQKGLRVGDKTRGSGGLSLNLGTASWLPRRSFVIAAIVICLLVLPLLHPDVKFIAQTYSQPLITAIKARIDPYLNPAPVVAEPALPEPALPAPPAVVEQRALVDVESANIRSGPSTQTEVVQSLPRDSSVIVLDAQGEWRQIRFGVGPGDTGWVRGDLLRDPS